MSFLRSLPLSNRKEEKFKIVSGGQTGVDRAALDIAIYFKISHGGWCPKGRLAEDGTIDSQYNLIESVSSDYSERTKLNIRDSDGTLIIIPSKVTITDGTILTVEEVKKNKKTYLIIDLEEIESKNEEINAWINTNNINVLNIAGPRESQYPGIYNTCLEAFNGIFSCYKVENNYSSSM